MPKINVEKIQSLTGHKDCLYTTVKGEEDHLVYTSGGDGLVVRWDLKNPELGQMVAKVHNSVYALSLNQDTKTLFIGHNFEGIHALDLNSKESVNSAKLTNSYIFDICLVDNNILCADGDGLLIILNQADLSVVKKIKISAKSLRSLAYNKQKQEIAIGASDNHIYIISSTDYSLKQTLSGHTNSVFTVAYHPSKDYLLSAGRDAHLKIWDVDNYTISKDIVAHMYAINHITFSPDGEHFASCSMDKSIKLWDAETFDLLKVIDKARHAGHGTSVNKLAWCNYENLLISVSDDRSASIWNILTEY